MDNTDYFENITKKEDNDTDADCLCDGHGSTTFIYGFIRLSHSQYLLSAKKLFGIDIFIYCNHCGRMDLPGKENCAEDVLALHGTSKLFGDFLCRK